MTQQELAKCLNLDPTYLSQLENAHRKIDDFYVEKVKELVEQKKLGKSNPREPQLDDLIQVKSGDRLVAAKRKCLEYLREYLSTCAKADQIGWTSVELRERFPLDKWLKDPEEPGALDEVDPEVKRVALESLKLAVDKVKSQSEKNKAERGQE